MSSSLPWDYIAKLVCIGDSGCGKSSLTIRLCEGRFSAQHDVTIGVEFGSRIVPVGPPHNKSGSSAMYSSNNSNTSNNTTDSSATSGAPSSHPPVGLPEPRRREPETPQKHMKLSLWDTAGQESTSSLEFFFLSLSSLPPPHPSIPPRFLSRLDTTDMTHD